MSRSDLSLFGPSGARFFQSLIKRQTFSFEEMQMKMSSTNVGHFLSVSSVNSPCHTARLRHVKSNRSVFWSTQHSWRPTPEELEKICGKEALWWFATKVQNIWFYLQSQTNFGIWHEYHTDYHDQMKTSNKTPDAVYFLNCKKSYGVIFNSQTRN